MTDEDDYENDIRQDLDLPLPDDAPQHANKPIGSRMRPIYCIWIDITNKTLQLK